MRQKWTEVDGFFEGWSLGLLSKFVMRVRRCISVQGQARWVARLLPAARWYAAAVTMASLRSRLTAWRGGNRRLSEAILFDTWLRELTLCGPFPIPYSCVGADVLEQARGAGPVLFCWQHLPLCSLPLPVIVDVLGEAPPVVADPGHIVGNQRFVLIGRAETAPALTLARPVLTRMRTLLREGTSVACLADDEMGGEFSDYGMRVAGMTGARVMFQWAARLPDSTIECVFRWAPRPLCDSDEAIAENMAFLQAERQRVLDALGWKPAT